MKQTLRNTKGITLIALVITIIILLILAGISISTLTNQGLFKNAKTAQNATEKAEAEQGKVLNEYEDEINKYLENDDKTYTSAETLKLCKALNIPMVLDVHHHNCNNNGENINDIWAEIVNTWNNQPLPAAVWVHT